ncbi:hypothetical protein RP20_CCG005876 [Aedes albopictus]|nr:hypothetical protein RP20_CCG005876 [Aedes albopictus]
MSENREEILANFQSITAIEDVAEAIYHLDECNWDLLSAVHRVLPQDPQEQRSSSAGGSGNGGGGGGGGGSSNLGSGGGAFASYSNNLNSLEATANVEELMTAPSSPVKSSAGGTAGSSAGSSHSRNLDMDFFYDDPFGLIEPGASTSRSSSSNDFRSALNYLDVTPHDVVFRIHFNNDVHKITVPNTATVGELKAKICEKTAVPVCRQALKGWEPGKQVGHVVFRNVLCKLILSIVERITKFLDGAQVAQYRQRGQFSPIRHDRRGFHG